MPQGEALLSACGLSLRLTCSFHATLSRGSSLAHVCVQVYHLSCIGMSEVPKGRWSCHWHFCSSCGRGGRTGGGVLFRCLDCPLSYCFDCWPQGLEPSRLPSPPPEFMEYFHRMGFEVPGSSAFYRCGHCLQYYNEMHRIRESIVADKELKSALAEVIASAEHALTRIKVAIRDNSADLVSVDSPRDSLL
jgi:hypothetical protein